MNEGKKRVLIKQLCTLEPINGVSTVFNGQNPSFLVKKETVTAIW